MGKKREREKGKVTRREEEGLKSDSYNGAARKKEEGFHF